MNRTFSLATALIVVALVGGWAIRLHGQQSQPLTKPPAAVTTAASESPSRPTEAEAKAKTGPQTKKDEPVPARLSGDQAYRANCTRCHSELPKLQPRAMKTVLMHMRVRGNIPKDEARAILDYLTR